MPLWASGIVGLHWVFGGGDDAYWWAAISFATLIGAICLGKRCRRLALCCIGVALLVFMVAVLLPSFNRTN